jgi:hypothetical protein
LGRCDDRDPIRESRRQLTHRLQFLLYRGKKAQHGAVLEKLQPYGKSEEETPAQDEQAQAPQALEVASSPEAHLAEVGARFPTVTVDELCARRRLAAGFRFLARRSQAAAAVFKKK